MVDREAPHIELGDELVERARSQHPDLPVLYVTGHWPDSRPAESAEDPTFLLPKPFTPTELRDKVQVILRLVRGQSTV